MVDPVLTSALSQDGAFLFGAVRIALPGGVLRLLDGAGQIVIGGETYTGEDADFGVLESIESISENEGEEAPEIKLSLLPRDGVAAATLASAAMQGSEIKIMVGAVDPATGLVIGTPEVLFLGEVDVPRLIINGQTREVEFTAVSVFERLFEVDEGVRASDGWHQSIWPGERGLEYVTGTDKNLYWGGKRPAGQAQAAFWGGIEKYTTQRRPA